MTTINNGEGGLSVRNKLNDIWAGLKLNAYDTSIAATAVDVFVYDTSKDSDGGAWRKRTQHTSWYNETLNTATRGGRREFPAVAVIVAEASKVTIYDGDDPTLPMWRVTNAVTGTIPQFWRSSRNAGPVTAINGKIAFGIPVADTQGGLLIIDFPSDTLARYGDGGTSDGELQGVTNDSSTTATLDSSYPALVNNGVNDVAMTVLPDAPIDPATGLPVPVIAVATAGGVSVIKDDGTVVDITGQATSVLFVSFNADDELITTGNYQDQYYVYGIPPTDILQNDATYRKRFYVFNASPAVLSGTALDLIDGYKGSSAGLTVLAEDQATPANGMVAHVTSSYNSGYQNGDIKGAFLSDTDTASLVGSGELVTNGTFDTDTSGWTAEGGSVSWSSGQLLLTEDGADGVTARAYQTISTVVGSVYCVTADIGSVSLGNVLIAASNSTGTGGKPQVVSAGNETVTLTFTAEAATTYIIAAVSGTTSRTAYFDNISVKLADADRSVNNNGLIVNGTVTRSAVATGAELVAYSGFSTTNYLEQPYNSDLDFGTGDFCVMGWVKPASVDADYIFDCRDQTVTPTGFFLYINGSGQPTFYTQGGGSSALATSSQALSIGSWQHVVGVRHGGINYIYLNGVLTGTTSGATQNVNNTSRTLIVGNSIGLFSYHALQSSLALLRISATAPTAEQIKKIYEDEKVLFQENAAATLYGASDAVTALAHDSDTGLLHVGTSAGRSVFQGLRRVSNTTTAVGTAISAANNLIVEE